MVRNYIIQTAISKRLRSCEVNPLRDDLFRYNYAGIVSWERCTPVRPQQHTQNSRCSLRTYGLYMCVILKKKSVCYYMHEATHV
jgi:hypothetical protein